MPEQVDYVFHLASPASPIDYLRLPLHTLKVGSYGTHNAIGLAKFKRARFLLASTSEVYGDPQVHPQPESYWGNVNPIGPRGVYDEAKRYAEAMVMAYHRQQGVDTCIARIFNTYGPRMRPNDGRAMPDLHASGHRRQAADRLRRRHADAVVLLRRRPHRRPRAPRLQRRAHAGEHRQPGGDDPPRPGAGDHRGHSVFAATSSTSALPIDDPKIRRPDISKAKRLLEWEPIFSLRQGLEKLYAYEHQWVSHSLTGLEYEKPKVTTVSSDAAEELLAGDAGVRSGESTTD